MMQIVLKKIKKFIKNNKLILKQNEDLEVKSILFLLKKLIRLL